MHGPGGNVRAGGDPLPGPGVRREVTVVAGGVLAAHDEPVDRDGRNRGSGCRGRADDDLSAGGGLPRRCLRRRVVELVCELAMELGEELGERRGSARHGGLEVDRGADLRGLEVVRPERRWSPASKQVVDVPAQSTRVHGLSSSLICAASLKRAASRSARFWSTLALATLTRMSAADSLIERLCRNRSSRIRRYWSGSASSSSATRCGAVLTASSLSGGASMSSIDVISCPSVARQCAARTVRAVARR